MTDDTTTGAEELQAACDAFSRFGESVASAGDAFRSVADTLIEFHQTAVIEPAWLHAHPGRRLPGGLSNQRLRKKRRDYLPRWWENEGEDHYWWAEIPATTAITAELTQ